jgi:hypothetical protein
MASEWTDDAIACAKRHNAAGLSRSQIAVEIAAETGQRFSRNAVIGKLARLGEVSPHTLKPRAERAVRQTQRPRRRSVNGLQITTVPKFNRVKHIDPVDDSPAPEPLNIPFGERADHQCGFICSPDGAPVLCCGHPQTSAPRRDGSMGPSPYCQHHHNKTHIGFSNERRRERIAA